MKLQCTCTFTACTLVACNHLKCQTVFSRFSLANINSVFLTSVTFYLASSHHHRSDVYPRCEVPPARRRVSSLQTDPPLLSETGEVSIPRPGPRIKTQILAEEIIQVPSGSANLSAVPGAAASLKVDNRCLCEARAMPAASGRSSRQPLSPAV